eukprot:SAG31_NODE_33832_length_339_cov_1.250000_1_plen_113_part_11
MAAVEEALPEVPAVELEGRAGDDELGAYLPAALPAPAHVGSQDVQPLDGQKLSQLRKLAVEEGVGSDAVDAALDSDTPRSAIISLIEERRVAEREAAARQQHAAAEAARQARA